MSRNTFTSPGFTCALECQQCEFIKSDGQRCRNRVCFGTPLCWVHTKRVYGVQSRDSTVANAGKGLFATKDFEEGEYIIPYIGEIITENCLNQRYDDEITAPYTTDFSRRRYIDSACQRGTASRANGLFRSNGRSRTRRVHNAEIVNRPSQGIWLQATRDIDRGNEIFVWYGNNYILQNNHETKRTRRQDNRPC